MLALRSHGETVQLENRVARAFQVVACSLLRACLEKRGVLLPGVQYSRVRVAAEASVLVVHSKALSGLCVDRVVHGNGPSWTMLVRCQRNQGRA